MTILRGTEERAEGKGEGGGEGEGDGDPGVIPSQGRKNEDLRAEKKTTQQVSGKPTWHLCNLYVRIILPPETK